MAFCQVVTVTCDSKLDKMKLVLIKEELLINDCFVYNVNRETYRSFFCFFYLLLLYIF